jgi:hypothetical protein
MDFAGYEISVTSQELPHLEVTWTNIDTPTGSLVFKRDTDKSKTFQISGYISKSTWALTKLEAEGLNTALNTTPSGVFTDGFGTHYSCLVEDWSISAVPAVNKYTFSMTLRIL